MRCSRRSFTIDQGISRRLDEVVPRGEQSQFVALALVKAFGELNRAANRDENGSLPVVVALWMLLCFLIGAALGVSSWS